MIREQTPADANGVSQVLTAAFADDGRVGKLAAALLARADRPGAAFVAEEAGEVVGHVQLSISWVDAHRELVRVLVLSPLGVSPSRQRQGIGRALVGAAVDAAARLGAPAVFLEGDPAYYAKLGWERASSRGFTAPSIRIPDAAFQVIVLPAWEPSVTGALVYNDTFWMHDCVGLRPAT
jgi:putative acetyltransferase